MTQSSKWFLLALRIALGSLFLYAGLTKVFDPAWSAAGYLRSAKTFPALFEWFASPAILPVVNFANEWGLTLLGISLILGAWVRLSGVLGTLLMLLYYLAALDFPYPNAHALIVDEHVIYGLTLLFFAAFRAGRVVGLDAKLRPGHPLG